MGKFFLHFLLDVGIVLHLGEQRLGGAEISWQREEGAGLSGEPPRRNTNVVRGEFGLRAPESSTSVQGGVDLLRQLSQLRCKAETDGQQ